MKTHQVNFFLAYKARISAPFKPSFRLTDPSQALINGARLAPLVDGRNCSEIRCEARPPPIQLQKLSHSFPVFHAVVCNKRALFTKQIKFLRVTMKAVYQR